MKSGFSIVEFMVAAALFVIIAGALGGLAIQGTSASRTVTDRTQAQFFAQEGLEAVRSIRNRNYGLLINGTYGLTTTNGYWEFAGSSDTTDGYTRSVTITDGGRDGVSTLVDSGGTPDPNTKKITTTVSWYEPNGTQKSITDVTYLTNWASNIVTLTPTNTPTPGNTCQNYCFGQGYATGVCRPNATQCTNNGETYSPGGNVYCPGAPPSDSCCCGGTAPTPTPTPLVSNTPTPTPTRTPTPTITPTRTPTPTVPVNTCTYQCNVAGHGVGTCRQNSNQCGNNGEIYVSSGNVYCTGGPNADTCCCQP